MIKEAKGSEPQCEECGYVGTLIVVKDADLAKLRRLCLTCYALAYTPAEISFTRDEWDSDESD